MASPFFWWLHLLPEGWRGRLLHRLGVDLSPAALTDALTRLLAARAEALPAAQALGLLLGLDNRIYTLTGDQAVRWGEGVHPKHRVMAYHDFFIARLTPGERVLDIGCGQGLLAWDMAERAGVRVTAVDLAEENIRVARERHGHARVAYRVGDARADLPGEGFDVVVMSNVLEHLPPDRSRFLGAVQAECRPRRWLLRVPAVDRDWRVPVKQELGVEWRLDTTHYVEYTLALLEAELTAAGLVMDEVIARWGEYWVTAHAVATAPGGEGGADVVAAGESAG